MQLAIISTLVVMFVFSCKKTVQPPLYLRQLPELAFKFEWPDACELELNESQKVAYTNALTHEFSLIQGTYQGQFLLPH